MFAYVTMNRSGPSSDYLYAEYQSAMATTDMCPCSLFYPYNSRSADSESNHDLMSEDTKDYLCFSCLRFEPKWNDAAQREYDQYYAPLYTQREKEEIYRLKQMETEFWNKLYPEHREGAENNLSWLAQALAETSPLAVALTKQQKKNQKKRERKQEKQLQMISDKAISAAASE